jgi:hypothetical protein
MKTHQKSWMLNVFSSARVLRSYTMEQLVGLGIGWVWMGIAGRDSQYRKLEDWGYPQTRKMPSIAWDLCPRVFHYRT